MLDEPSSALVISGFLGAGKTSLVRSLLRQAQNEGIRLAVISNEFGALGIDRALLQSEQWGEYVELEGGCVCCQLSSELLETLQKIWERNRPHRIIVETSGLALPFETLMTFWREPVSQWVSESLAVVVVNAEQLATKRDIEGLFEQQVSSADLLVLNKTDLVDTASLDQLESFLTEMAPDTPVIRSSYGQVDSRILFTSLTKNDLPQAREGNMIDSQVHAHDCYEVSELDIEPGIDLEEVIAQVQALNPVRVKGVVETNSGPVLVQGVGPRFDQVPAPEHFPARLRGRLVVIRRKSR